MSRLSGKTAIITGAASGVGRETALLFAQEGAKVLITDVNTEQGEALAEQIGSQASFCKLNIAHEADWQTAFTEAEQRFGQVHILVNNAAILQIGDIETATISDFKKIMEINAMGYFLGCQFAVKAMKKSQQSCAIVNMASLAAIAGMPIFAAYSCSKGAVTALTRVVAIHCKNQGYPIRCNAVLPDGILTPMIANLMPAAAPEQEPDPKAFARMTTPDNIAKVIAFLASDESVFINGMELKVDNGFTVTGI